MEQIQITTSLPREENYYLPKAACVHYDPQSEIEGRCALFPTLGLVSRIDGCDHPESCSDLKRYGEAKKTESEAKAGKAK
jgi:hypothetical protein